MSKASGNLFSNRNKAKDTHPDFQGDMKFPKALVEEMMRARTDADGNVVVKIAGWRKQGPRAGNYISMSADMPMDRNEPRTEDRRPSGGNRGDSRQASFPDDLDDSDIPF